MIVCFYYIDFYLIVVVYLSVAIKYIYIYIYIYISIKVISSTSTSVYSKNNGNAKGKDIEWVGTRIKRNSEASFLKKRRLSRAVKYTVNHYFIFVKLAVFYAKCSTRPHLQQTNWPMSATSKYWKNRVCVCLALVLAVFCIYLWVRFNHKYNFYVAAGMSWNIQSRATLIEKS